MILYKELTEPLNPKSNIVLRKGDIDGLKVNQQTGSLDVVINSKPTRLKDCFWFGKQIIVNNRIEKYPSIKFTTRPNEEVNIVLDFKNWHLLRNIDLQDFSLFPENDSFVYIFSLRTKAVIILEAKSCSLEGQHLVVLTETEEYKIDLRVNQIFFSKVKLKIYE